MDSNVEAHQQEHCSAETKGKKGKAKAMHYANEYYVVQLWSECAHHVRMLPWMVLSLSDV
jgi:hypothetical protein